MSNPCRVVSAVIAGLWLACSLGAPVHAQVRSPVSGADRKDAVVTNHARGTFEVKVTPSADVADGAPFGRLSIDKQFHGDLEATSKGEMLAAGTGVTDSSGGYVALELVHGTLQGCGGTFVLQHSGTMTRGAQQLSITVVPDSGTGQLQGLAGKMGIVIADGRHSYDFEYTIVEKP